VAVGVQAVELDELQREHSQSLGLRQELAAAKEAAVAAGRRAEGLAEELAAAQGAPSTAGDQVAAQLQAALDQAVQERDVLRRERDAREAEVMSLQGQVKLLENCRSGDVENWLTA
jgi:hypothetical protein